MDYRHHFIVTCACLLSLNSAAASYPVNYLSAKLGASVATESKLSGQGRPELLLSDGPVSKGRISFAGIQQRRMFTVDLGSERTFNRVEVNYSGNKVSSVVIRFERAFSNTCSWRRPRSLTLG